MKKNKFSIRLLLIILGLLLCIQIPTFAANKGKSTATNVRIRKSASTQSEVIDVLATGEEVEILTEEGDWYKVKAKGHTGYVSKSFINVDGNAQSNNEQVQENNNQENKVQENNNQENKVQGNNNQENKSEENAIALLSADVTLGEAVTELKLKDFPGGWSNDIKNNKTNGSSQWVENDDLMLYEKNLYFVYAL